MRRALLPVVGLLLLTSAVRADERPRGKVVYDVWEAVLIGGSKSGLVHTLTVEQTRGGQKVLQTSEVLELTMKRGADTVRMRAEVGSTESPEGKVTAVSFMQQIAKDQEYRLTGTVEGNTLHVKGDGAYPIDRRIPLGPDVLGLYRQQQIFKDRRVKPGDRFRYQSYEAQVNAIVGVQVTVGDEEEIAAIPGKPKQRLLRVQVVPDRIGGVQLPAMIGWLDREYEMLRSEVDMPSFGRMVRYRTTEKLAQQPGTGALPEIQQLIRLNRRIPNAHETSLAVYRITLKGDEDPREAFVQDDRQQVKNLHGRTFELHVRAVRGPQPGGKSERVADEFLKSNFFINCDDARVQALARRAIGKETEPWKQALRIESWVRHNMRITNYTEAMATADHVARTLEGDCTEFSMLAAAMCRAVGVPSRTAIGFVYTEDRKRGPAMGFHMWTEVWVRGQWLPIDATLGQGYVGAAHLKVTDASWHNAQALTPLVPLFRVMGKITIEVVRTEVAD